MTHGALASIAGSPSWSKEIPSKIMSSVKDESKSIRAEHLDLRAESSYEERIWVIRQPMKLQDWLD